MDKQEVLDKTGVALSQISEALGSADDSHMLRLLAKPDSVGKLEQWVGDIDAFGKASTALGVAGMGLQFAVAVFGGESPEQKIIKMVGALTKQVSSFENDVKNQFKRLGVEVAKLAGEEEIFDHLNYITTFQQATDSYWEVRCTNKNELKHYIDAVLEFNCGDLRAAVTAIHKITRQGAANSNILDKVYTTSYGGDDVRQLGMCLLSHANAAPAIEAAFWAAKYQDSPELLPSARDDIAKIYDHKLNEIKAAVTTAVKRCVDFESLKTQYPLLTTNFCSKQKGERWVTVGKQAFFTEVAEGLIKELSCYPWFDWAVAIYDGYSGVDNHGYKLSHRRLADSQDWPPQPFPNGGNLRVNVVVYVRERDALDIRKDPRDGGTLQGVVNSMPADRTTGGGYSPYEGKTDEHVKKMVTDVRPYLNELENKLLAAFISIHLVRSSSVPCFRASDPQSIMVKVGPAFTGCCFI